MPVEDDLHAVLLCGRMSAAEADAQRRQHAGRWVLLDARFHLLSIGRALYQGNSPRTSLDVTARRILLPRMRAACIDGLPHAQVHEDFGRRWTTAVRPILGPVSGQPLAVLGCYGPADAPLPQPPLVGGWEWQVTPPGPEQQLRIYWSEELFAVYGNAVPAGPGPHWREAAQWLDEVVEATHRTEIQRVLQTLRTATSDALLIHSYAARNSDDVRLHLRMAGRRDVTTPGPDTWLRGVTMRLKHAGGVSADADSAPSYLDAAFALSRDALCAIDTLYEHVYLTSAPFADLGVALPAHRHLPQMCHPDDLSTLRTMLRQAAADTSVPAAAVRVRLAGVDGIWREVEIQGSGVQLTTEPPHHVLCRVTSVH